MRRPPAARASGTTPTCWPCPYGARARRCSRRSSTAGSRARPAPTTTTWRTSATWTRSPSDLAGRQHPHPSDGPAHAPLGSQHAVAPGAGEGLDDAPAAAAVGPGPETRDLHAGAAHRVPSALPGPAAEDLDAEADLARGADP